MVTEFNLELMVYWINALLQDVREYKAVHPEARIGFCETSVGSLLNAYREGDLSFDECVGRIEAMIDPEKGRGRE